MSGSAISLETLALGLLVGRVVLGLVMAAHGAQKLFGWFGGYGLGGTGAFMTQLGFPAGRAFAGAAGLAEVTGGLLVALGLLWPVGPALVVSVMVVAAITVHWQHGLFATNNGIELPLLYATGAVVLAFTGFGAFSLDAALGLAGWWTPALTAGVLAAGAIGGIGNTTLRRRPLKATA